MEVKVAVTQPATTAPPEPVVPDFTELDDTALAALQERVNREVQRRAALKAAVEQVDAANRAFLRASGRAPGEPWVQPTGAVDAYPEGWVVTDEGKVWESLIPGNVWKPGASGWRQVGTETETGGDAPAWVQPAGAHDAYTTGDLVTFDGKTYRSLINDNVWSPAAYPAAWEQV